MGPLLELHKLCIQNAADPWEVAPDGARSPLTTLPRRTWDKAVVLGPPDLRVRILKATTDALLFGGSTNCLSVTVRRRQASDVEKSSARAG